MTGIDRATAQWYIDTALAKLLTRADELVEAGGDELLCRAPEVEGANSVFALITHCCGVMERWGGEVIAGRQINRDRRSEFTATGSLDHLEARVSAQLGRWREEPRRLRRGCSPARTGRVGGRRPAADHSGLRRAARHRGALPAPRPRRSDRGSGAGPLTHRVWRGDRGDGHDVPCRDEGACPSTVGL